MTVPLTTGPPQLQAQGVPGLLFIATLFTIAKTWKQPRCPSTDAWIKKLSYIYAMEYYSAIKRNECDSVELRWMSLELVIQSEISQKEKNKCHILTRIYIWNLEKWYWLTCLQVSNRDAGIENGLVDTAGEGEDGTNSESSTDIYSLHCVK